MFALQVELHLRFHFVLRRHRAQAAALEHRRFVHRRLYPRVGSDHVVGRHRLGGRLVTRGHIEKKKNSLFLRGWIVRVRVRLSNEHV